MIEKILLQKFQATGLDLKIFSHPIIRNTTGPAETFQMTIASSNGKEWFEVFIANANVSIVDYDKQLKQVVLRIQEPEQEFYEEIKKPKKNKIDIRKRLIEQKAKFFETERKFVVIRKTESKTKYFLVGLDGKHLFIAQITKPVMTVNGARKNLGENKLINQTINNIGWIN